MTPEQREKKRINDAKYRQTHREKIAKYQSEYGIKNTETLRKYKKEWNAANREKMTSYYSDYFQSNRASHHRTKVRCRLSREVGCAPKDIPTDLVETKLAILTVKRKVKELMK